jgi:HEAT repeat protein
MRVRRASLHRRRSRWRQVSLGVGFGLGVMTQWVVPGVTQPAPRPAQPDLLLPALPAASPSQVFPQPLPGRSPEAAPDPLRDLSVEALLEKLRTARMKERSQIIQALVDRGSAAVPKLIAGLAITDPLVRSGAATALGQLGDEASAAVPALVKVLSDNRRAVVMPENSLFAFPVPSSPFSLLGGNTRPIPTPPENPRQLIRIYAVAAIGQINGNARTIATAPVAQLLKDADPWVRLNAAWALTEMGAEIPVLAVYVELLQNPDPELRRGTAQVIRDRSSLIPKVIGAEATPTTATQLVKSLADPDDIVQASVADLLTQMGQDAVPALTTSLKDANPLIRLTAARILGQIGPTASAALPLLSSLLQDQARFVEPPRPTNRLSPFVIAPLPLYLPDGLFQGPPPGNPERLVRAEAAVAIGRIGTVPSDARQRLETAALKDPSPWMRLRSTWALLKVGSDVAPLLPPLAQTIQAADPDLREATRSLLKQMGSPAASILVDYYISQLANPQTRTDAVLNLGDRGLGAAALLAVPKIRPYLEGDDRVLRGYTATILANIADEVRWSVNRNGLSSQQLDQAITEFSRALEILQKPTAKFNSEPVQRLQNSLNGLKQRQGRR